MMLGEEGSPETLPGGGGDPLSALEAIVAPALAAPPCLVSFSGGRDSSALLAAAARAARRHGLPPPVPVTFRVAGAPEMDESAWQERVVSHLGLPDWERLEAGDELDLAGPVAQDILRRHGILFPPSFVLLHHALERTAAGPLLTGVGGDSVFGGWRFAGLSTPAARERAPALAYALAPRRVRRAYLRRRVPALPWLRPSARELVVEQWTRSEAREPARWDRQLEWRAGLRRVTALRRTTAVLAADAGREILHPFLDPRFLAALARAGGRRGLGARTSTMRALFSGLLPPDVLAREGKARPVNVFFREPARALARRWDGRGLSDELVDAEALRREWLGPRPNLHTTMLVQAVWLAAR